MGALWDRIFPPLPDTSRLLPPPQPQIEAWTDNSHLYDVTLDGLGIPTDRLPISRAAAMRVPAVARARNLTAATIGRLPLEVLRRDTPVPDQPYWAYGTDGQLGDLSTADLRRWGLGPQSPYHRMVWTVDDLFFHGESLWMVTATTDQTAARPLPLRMLRVPWDQWEIQDGQIVDLDNEPLPEDRLIYVPGAHEGILTYGATSIRTAAELEQNAADVAKRPLRLEAHQTTTAELTRDERREITDEIRAAMAQNDGILFTNSAIELIEHRVDAEALQLGARNASALDVARLGNMPAAMLDATSQGASLEYQTLVGRNQQWLDYGLQVFVDPITARLSMDDVLPAGQRASLNTDDWTAPDASPTGPPVED